MKQINAHNLFVLILLANDNFFFLKLQIQNRKWLENMSLLLLCVMALDRFGDFVSDEVCVKLSADKIVELLLDVHLV